MTEPSVIKWGSLCTADCEDGYHVPAYEKCDRCGSQIHFRVIEVFDPQRGLITVGSECIKPIMGWKWNKSHEEALAIQSTFDEELVFQGTWVTEVARARPTLLTNLRLRDALQIGKGSSIAVSGWVARIWRAAEDLGLPWDVQEHANRATIATRAADVSLDTFAWTAKLPGEVALGGQEREAELAGHALARALETLFNPRADYNPRGAIWTGSGKIVEKGTWRRFKGYVSVPPTAFGWHG